MGAIVLGIQLPAITYPCLFAILRSLEGFDRIDYSSLQINKLDTQVLFAAGRICLKQATLWEVSSRSRRRRQGRRVLGEMFPDDIHDHSVVVLRCRRQEIPPTCGL